MTKRTRTAALAGALCLTLCGTSWGFTTPTGTSSRPSLMESSSRLRVVNMPHHTHRCVRSNMALMAARTSRQMTQGLHQNQKGRLGKDEEMDLLRQAVEWRRLTALEKEMALSSSTKTLPLLSVRAKAAGYGEDLEAYELAVFEGQLAREALVTRNMGLVHYSVTQILGSKKAYRLNSLSRDDLVQEGAIGLARAVEKWNPAIGGRFSSYAVYWIRAAVFRCIAERDDVVRVPEYVSRSISQINKAAKRLGMDIDGDAMGSSSWKMAQQAKELAEEAGLTDKQLTEALKARSRRYSGGYVPFHSWMQQGKDLYSDIPTTIMTSQEQEVESSLSCSGSSTSSLQMEHLRTTLSKFLRPKEMEALFWRYGLVEDDGSASTGSASVMEVQTPPPQQQRFSSLQKRDYVGDAEEELFGSRTPRNRSTAKMTQTRTTRRTTTTSPPPTLPTKGKWGEAMTFTEVGKRMEVSAEYTRRLCHKGLEKLRSAADEGALESAFLSF